MRMSLRFAIGLAALLLSPAVLAVPAPPFAIPLKNADGSVVMGRMFGDEHLSWIEDLTGYALAKDPASGDWRYAVRAADGRLAPSALRVGHADPRSVGIAPHLTPGREQMRRALGQRAPRPDPLPPPAPRAVKNLVLLVRFANQTSHFTPTDFDPVFNGSAHSVRDFYHEASYGQFDLSSTIIDWIPLPHDDLYYAYNDQHPDGHPEQMIWDAVAYLDANNFDFSPYDADGNGIIDAVDIIHSGPGYETAIAGFLSGLK